MVGVEKRLSEKAEWGKGRLIKYMCSWVPVEGLFCLGLVVANRSARGFVSRTLVRGWSLAGDFLFVAFEAEYASFLRVARTNRRLIGAGRSVGMRQQRRVRLRVASHSLLQTAHDDLSESIIIHQKQSKLPRTGKILYIQIK